MQHSLQRRIIASVLLGLAVVLLGIAILVALAVTQSLQAALGERLAVAYAKEHEVAEEVDDALAVLTRAAALEIPPRGRVYQAGDLRLLLDVVGVFPALAIVDRQGVTLFYARRTTAGPAADDTWPPPPAQVRPLLASRRPAVSGGLGRAGPLFAAPVTGGGLEGAWLLGRLDLRRLARHLAAEHSIHGTYEIELLTNGGAVAAAYPESVPISAHRALVRGFSSGGEAGVVLHRTPGSAGDHYVAYVPLRRLPGWGVVIEQPRDIVVALPQRLWRWMMGIGFLVLLVGAAVAWFDVRRVVTPLRDLATTTGRFAQGDLEMSVRVDRTDEIGLLARTLEEMRTRLRASLQEIGRREERTRALYRLSTQILASPNRDDVLRRVVDEAQGLLAADAAVLCLRDEPNHPIGTGLRHPSEAVDPPCACDSQDARCSLVAALGGGVHKAVPVTTGEKVIGQLCVARRDAVAFTGEDEALLSGFGNLAALTVVNARLHAEVRGLSVLAERERIARELHDGLAQALGMIYAQAKVAEERVGGTAAPAGGPIHEILDLSSRAYEEVRQSIFGLRTMVARRLGLVPALTEYLHEFSEHTGIAVELSAPEPFGTLPPDAEAQLIRIVQEALTNVWRHARARHAWVTFDGTGEKREVTVQDDGVGFDRSAVAAEGVRRFGLETMVERAEAIGGVLEIESAPGRGTRVVVTLPPDRTG